jgi:alpha-amylase
MMRVAHGMILGTLIGLTLLVGLPAASADMGGDGKIDETDSCYFVVTDRFSNGDPGNDNQGCGEFNPDDPNFYHGGDWKGIKDKLGYIAGMGFTCIWVTPVVENWNGAYIPTGKSTKYTAYHGYHAFDFLNPNRHFGTWNELKELVSAAHDHNIDVIIDQVYNHMSPIEVINDFTYPSFSYDDFHHCKINCNAENRDLYNLADLNTGKAFVRDRLATQHAGYYNFVNADGMRLDTVRNIAPNEWGEIISLMHSKIVGADRTFTLGEAFDIDGMDESIAGTIGQYTKPPANLTAVVNFLLYRTILDFQDVDAAKLGAVRYWQFTQNKFTDPFSLGNFIDNHDVPRFLCDHANSHEKLKQALNVVFTWPGFPIVYYGTEQGANGCHDPANREDMWTLGTVPFNENSDLYTHIERLNAVRNSRNIVNLTFTNGRAGQAIRNGTIEERWVSNCLYAFERKTPGNAQVALVMLNACPKWQEMTDLRTDIGSGWKQETTYGFKWINADATGLVSSYWLAPYETLIFEN